MLDLPPLPLAGPGRAFLNPAITLNGYSDLVAPKPSAIGPDNHYLTGYWFLDFASWLCPSAPLRLVDFLSSGSPPVCVGFGCNHNRDAAEVTDIVVSALKKAGRRGLLPHRLGRFGSGVDDSDQFLALESAPAFLAIPTYGRRCPDSPAAPVRPLRASEPERCRFWCPSLPISLFGRSTSYVLAPGRRPSRARN